MNSEVLIILIYVGTVVLSFIATALWARLSPADKLGKMLVSQSVPNPDVVVAWVFAPVTLVVMACMLIFKLWNFVAYYERKVNSGNKKQGGYR